MLQRSAMANGKMGGGGGCIAHCADEPVRAYIALLALTNENEGWPRNGFERHDRKWITTILLHFGDERIE